MLKGMGGALDGRGVWMARTRMTASCRHVAVRRVLVAALTLAMTMGRVPTAAFAEALGVDTPAVESLAGELNRRNRCESGRCW